MFYANGTYITFTEKLTYLGSVITSSLQDDEDVNNRISKASRAFGALRHNFFANSYIPLTLKRSLYLSIVVNLLL